MSIKGTFVDMYGPYVDIIDTLLRYVDKKAFYRHILVTCRLNRQVAGVT